MIPENPSSKDPSPPLPENLRSSTSKKAKEKEDKVSKIAKEKRTPHASASTKLTSEIKAKPAPIAPMKGSVSTTDSSISATVDRIGSSFPSFFFRG